MAKILIVEPEEILLGLISSSLKFEGHHTVEARNSTEALTELEGVDTFDLVIAELDLKPFSGLKLARMIASRNMRAKVVFICDDRAVAGVLSGSLGTRFLIEKPFTSEDLRRQVRRVLASRKTLGAG